MNGGRDEDKKVKTTLNIRVTTIGVKWMQIFQGGINVKKRCIGLILSLLMLLQFVPASTVQAAAISTSRLAGSDRYATAVAISQAGWSQADTVIIATGLNYPDALAASALTKSKDAPILLTETAAMDQSVVDEIKRLKATKAILIGGTGVVGTGVEDQLIGLGLSITRLGGTDRYDTSVKIGETIGVSSGIIVATGLNFPDALSIAPIAAIKSMPVLLSPGDALDPYVSAYIAGKSIPVSYILGGSDVVSDVVASSVPNSKRLSGGDRYATNMSIINKFAGDLNFDTVYLATGLNFPDALSGSALAAKNNAPIILTEQDSISPDVLNLITSMDVKNVVILGGTNVVSQNIEDTINGIVSPTSVSLNQNTASLTEARLLTLTASVKPDNATNKNVTWTTSDKNVATVSSKGVVTAVNPGTATITATTNDEKLTAFCAVAVASGKLTDNKAIYSNENDDVENVYVTIVTDNTVTFDEVNAWNIDSPYPKPEINVRFDYSSPATDVTGAVSNAVLSQRGQAVTFADLKSYKIKLSDTATKWKGQKTLNFNKHPSDLTRLRNKIAFDLMEMFPDTFSLRNQFCHLYIRDLNNSSKSYVDYGLYTQIEEPNKDWLESRGIEKTAYIYKAEDFKFQRYPDAIKNVNDPSYNVPEFEKILEIKGMDTDHSRLIAMLNDVNDESLNINDVIAKWFDRDNYITWLAINFLLGNYDTVSSNFYIMSPVDQDKWYFIPWDYDESLGFYAQLGTDNSQYRMDGIATYWSVVLHRRFLENPQNLADVTAKMEELSSIATEKVLSDKVSSCYASTNALVKRNPDLSIMDTSVANYEAEILRIPKVTYDIKQDYYKAFESPMPVVTHDVEISGGDAVFLWEPAYKFDSDTLHYDFTLSSDPGFMDVINEETGMLGMSVTVDSLPAGTYYWKVEVYDPSGNRAGTIDDYYDPDTDTIYFGVRQLIVN